MSVDVLRAGSQLAELMPSDRPGGYTVARVGTINEIHGSDGYLTADVLLSGGELLGLQLTTACVNARPGDRCVVEFYANIGVVTGVLARPGVDAPLFEWSSTWSGTPGLSLSVVILRRLRLLLAVGLSCARLRPRSMVPANTIWRSISWMRTVRVKRIGVPRRRRRTAAR